MDTRFLSSLVAVVETGSIAAAARNQHLTPAAVSQRVKVLENTLNCQLLMRTSHSAKPTEQCLKILPRLLKIAAMVEQIESDLEPQFVAGTLKVGVISSVLSGHFPSCIAKLAKCAPKLILQIIPGSSEQLYQQLLAQKIDVAILVEPSFNLPKVIEKSLLYSEPLIFISASPVTDIQLAIEQQPFIQYDKQAWGGSIANQYLVDHQLTPKVLCEIDALESIALMVSQGMGVSLTPYWQGLTNILAQAHCQKINQPRYQRSICLLSHRQNTKQRLISQLLSTVQAQIGVK